MWYPGSGVGLDVSIFDLFLLTSFECISTRMSFMFLFLRKSGNDQERNAEDHT